MIPGLTHQESKIVAKILKDAKNVLRFSFFGSRVSGNHRKLSDLDICYRVIDEKLKSVALFDLESKFEDSKLPFKVDLVNFEQCAPDFQKLITDNECPFGPQK